MTKQEAIEKAWIDTGIDFEKIKPMLKVNEELIYDFKENGWIDFSLKVKEFEGYNPESLEIIGLRAARPKRLRGIDNNNGWIKIDSEADLPKQEGDYWVIYNDSPERIQISKYCIFNVTEEIHKGWWIDNITHYQPIKKPELPIY